MAINKVVEDIHIDKIGNGYVVKISFLYDDENEICFEDNKQVFLDKELVIDALKLYL